MSCATATDGCFSCRFNWTEPFVIDGSKYLRAWCRLSGLFFVLSSVFPGIFRSIQRMVQTRDTAFQLNNGFDLKHLVNRLFLHQLCRSIANDASRIDFVCMLQLWFFFCRHVGEVPSGTFFFSFLRFFQRLLCNWANISHLSNVRENWFRIQHNQLRNELRPDRAGARSFMEGSHGMWHCIAFDIAFQRLTMW